MIREFSAGIVPFLQKSGKRKYLLLLSNLTKGEVWEFPKGQIEKGEDAATAAAREFLEETGIEDWEKIPGFKSVLKYFYRRREKLITCRGTVVAVYAGTARRDCAAPASSRRAPRHAPR